MNLLADLTQRIATLEAKVNNTLQEGIVKAVRAADNLLDIEVRGVRLEKVPYLTWRAGTNGKTYWVPEVGESGMLLCPDGQAGNAIFLPALNTGRNAAPDTDPNVMHRIWKPGIFEKFDGNANEHLLSISGNPTRTTDPNKIQDAIGNSTRKAEANKIENKVSTAKETLEADKYEVKIPTGEIDHLVGTTVKIEMSDTDIKLTVGTNSILINATKVEMRTAATWIVLTAAFANVNGATFIAGVTNLIGQVPGTVIPYVPVVA